MQSVDSLFVADNALGSMGAMASHFRHSHSNSSGSAGYMLLPTQSAPLDGHSTRRGFGLDLGLECAAQQTVLQIQNTDLVCWLVLCQSVSVVVCSSPFLCQCHSSVSCGLCHSVQSCALLQTRPLSQTQNVC